MRPDDNFSAWIRAIQKARVLQFREDAWLEDEALVQVRRMREQDLTSQDYLHESDDVFEDEFFEDFVDEIKLSLPLPKLIEQQLRLSFYFFV